MVLSGAVEAFDVGGARDVEAEGREREIIHLLPHASSRNRTDFGGSGVGIVIERVGRLRFFERFFHMKDLSSRDGTLKPANSNSMIHIVISWWSSADGADPCLA